MSSPSGGGESLVDRLKEELQQIREAAEAYEKDPINMYDRPESWEKLFNLVSLALGKSK